MHELMRPSHNRARGAHVLWHMRSCRAWAKADTFVMPVSYVCLSSSDHCKGVTREAFLLRVLRPTCSFRQSLLCRLRPSSGLRAGTAVHGSARTCG
ncbi:hypothetical protein AGR8A_Cc60056 [Agrobacterium fabrum str. J-07]|nr:hypothetical protein AGR8A_Cc60056 [Agrobacterium fabrum str. J-07]